MRDSRLERPAESLPPQRFCSSLLWSLCLGLGLASGLVLVAAAPAAAERPDPRIEIHLEYFQPGFDSSIRLDSQEFGIGTALDLESDLALEDDASELRGELVFHAGERGRVAIDYAAFDRSGSARVGRQVRFGDIVYRADADLDASLESQFAAIGWGYALLHQDAAELGLSLSVAFVRLDASLTGLAVAQGGPSIVIEEHAEAEGPLPMLGVFGGWWFGDRFRLTASGRYLDIDELDGWSGSALDYGIRFEWFVLDNIAAAIGYGGTEIEAQFDDADDIGEADYSYDGLRAGVTFAF